MRIVQVAQLIHPTSGGLRTTVEHLAAGYTARGHERFLIVPGPRDDVVETPSGPILTLRAPLVPGTGGYRLFRSLKPIIELLDVIEPDVLEISDKVSLWRLGRWARSRRIPSVLISHERLDAILAGRLPARFPLTPAAAHWNRLVLSHVDLAVGASEFAVDDLRRCASPTPIVRIPLGVDLDVFHPDRRTSRDAHHPRIVYAGRLSCEKRPDLVVDCARSLQRRGRRADVVLIGDGPLRPSLEAQARGLNVVFRGHLAHREELACELANAAVVIAPCPVETFGLSALEAMAAGTPVVAVNQGALIELVTKDSGQLARPDAEGLADAIETVLDGDRDVWRLSSRRHAEMLSWENTVDRFMDVFDSLVAGRSARSLAA